MGRREQQQRSEEHRSHVATVAVAYEDSVDRQVRLAQHLFEQSLLRPVFALLSLLPGSPMRVGFARTRSSRTMGLQVVGCRVEAKHVR